jgi:hypothetical protein
MADWTTIASLGTAAGTLVLAAATFAAVRSSNQSARVTERALLAQIRPVLVPTRLTDETQKVGFIDHHWMRIEGQRAHIDVTDAAIYMAFTVRNVGAGIAVLDRWDLYTTQPDGGSGFRDPRGFRRLTRDIYVPAGDTGFWQGAFRDVEDPHFDALKAAIGAREAITVDLLYEDHEGGQRTISRFSLVPAGEDQWLVAVSRHWNLDRDDPR